jgi:hypothetical protein
MTDKYVSMCVRLYAYQCFSSGVSSEARGCHNMSLGIPHFLFINISIHVTIVYYLW